jgi:hypothetical protein
MTVTARSGEVNQGDFVTSFLYFFKPPFPSDGGYAAASAGRSGPSAQRHLGLSSSSPTAPRAL